ncbi:calcium channel flower [Trichonephila inaurata madagascariensis]|uniref:Calcium channel flower n=1 Tax=Trichonephila inaurata madagascariensis TaxID=2747483 RepID=A0A8X6XFC9_9ARAC|nr:calcium channel flower [Trichonephila inaurata madagascariensis]GFY51657.1 calcium channel flower [Trichonephila inaurata madagascariensis]
MMKPEPAADSARPQQTVSDDVPWWLKYGVRFVGSVAALAALALGAMACLTITPRCLLAGIIQMLCGVLVALIEAPFLCMFLDFAQIPSTYFDAKPPWLRGLLYIIISIFPISLCAGISTFFGSGLIFVTGSLYGLTSLRRKAPVQEMRMQASSSYNRLQNSQLTGDLETGTMQQKPGDPFKTSGVI